MSDAKKIDEDAMVNVLQGIAAMADAETPDEITYDTFMKADKNSSAYDIFNTYDMAAGAHVMTVCKIVKQKYDIKRMDDELYFFIAAFPFYLDRLGKEIQKTEGSACCVDKAWSRSMKKFGELIKANQAKEATA
jgi:hypothetical protein